MPRDTRKIWEMWGGIEGIQDRLSTRKRSGSRDWQAIFGYPTPDEDIERLLAALDDMTRRRDQSDDDQEATCTN